MSGEIPRGHRPELTRRDAIKLLLFTLGSLVGASCGLSQVDAAELPLQPVAETETFEATSTTEAETQVQNQINTEALLEESAKVFEIKTNLVGQAWVEGQIVELNFPEISTPVTIALHPSVMVPAPEGFEAVNLRDVPVEDIFLNNEYWDNKYGEGATERQILTDMMYMHYRAWQRDDDAKYLEEREGVSFFEYLTGLQNGEIDGSHFLRVREDTMSNIAYPESRVRINPLDPMVIMFGSFVSEEPGNPFRGGSLQETGDFFYNPETKTFMAIIDPRKNSEDIETQLPGMTPEEVEIHPGIRSSAYSSLIIHLSFMSFPEHLQWKLDPGDQEGTVVGQEIIEEIRDKFYFRESQGFQEYGNPPIIINFDLSGVSTQE